MVWTAVAACFHLLDLPGITKCTISQIKGLRLRDAVMDCLSWSQTLLPTCLRPHPIHLVEHTPPVGVLIRSPWGSCLSVLGSGYRADRLGYPGIRARSDTRGGDTGNRSWNCEGRVNCHCGGYGEDESSYLAAPAHHCTTQPCRLQLMACQRAVHRDREGCALHQVASPCPGVMGPAACTMP